MSKKRILTILPLVILIFHIFSSNGLAAPPKEEIGKSVNTEIVRESRSELREERQLLEQQAERHFFYFDNFVNRVIWGLGVLAAVAVALLYWSFGRTRTEMKNTIKELFASEATSLIEREADQLRQKYKELKTQVDELAIFKDRGVTWVSLETVDRMQVEIEALYALGLKNVQIITPVQSESLDIGTPDLVILSYNGTDEGKKLLKQIVDRLKNEAPPVFLIIYTYNPQETTEVRLNKEEREILAGFHWYVPTNFPAQLVLQTQLLIRRGQSLLKGNVYGQL